MKYERKEKKMIDKIFVKTNKKIESVEIPQKDILLKNKSSENINFRKKNPFQIEEIKEESFQEDIERDNHEQLFKESLKDNTIFIE